MWIRKYVNTWIRAYEFFKYAVLWVWFHFNYLELYTTWISEKRVEVHVLPCTDLKISFMKLTFCFKGMHRFRFTRVSVLRSRNQLFNVRNAPGITGKYIYRSSHRDRSDSAVDLRMRNRLFRIGRIGHFILQCVI